MKNTNIILDCLCREIRRLRKENRKLHYKHWNECRQIALYDDEVQRAKCETTLRDYARMCNSCGDECEGCPLNDMIPLRHCTNCQELLYRHREDVEAAISQWCAEHPEEPKSVSEQPEKPKKTYMQDFLEKFPKTMLREDGVPYCCRAEAYKYMHCKGECTDCWNEVMPLPEPYKPEE